MRPAVSRSTATSQSNLKYHVDAIDITERRRGWPGRRRRRHGRPRRHDHRQRRVAADDRHAERQRPGATARTARSTRTATYTVTVPDLDFANAQVRRRPTRRSSQVGGVELNEVTATTTYAQKRLEFDDQRPGADARARRDRRASSSIPIIRRFTCRSSRCARRASSGGRRRAARRPIQYRQRPRRDQERRARRAATSRSTSTARCRRWQGAADAGRARRARAQRRPRAAREAAAAEPRVHRPARPPTRRSPARSTDPRSTATSRSPTAGSRTTSIESLVADVDYGGTRDHARRHAAAVARRRDHRQGHGADERVQPATARRARRRQRPTTRSTCGSRRTPLEPRRRSGLHDRGHQRRRHAAGRRPRHRLGRATRTSWVSSTSRTARSRCRAPARPTRASTPASISSPTSSRIRRFEILDENGEQLAVAGQLAVHERQVGAVDFTLDSDNFEVIDNELGDVGVGTQLKITGELARPEARRRRARRSRPARGRPDPAAVLRPVSHRGPAGGRLGRAHGAERRAARKRRRGRRSGRRRAAAAAAGGATAGRRRGGAAARHGVFENVALDVHVRIPDNLVAARHALRPGGPTRRGARRHQHHRRRRSRRSRKEPTRRSRSLGTVNTVRGTYQFQGRQFDIARDGTLRFTGEPTQSAARRHRDARDSRHRRRGARAHHRHAQDAGARSCRARRRSRSPTSSRSSSSTVRSTSWARASARRWRRRPAGSRAASSPRRSASRSAGRGPEEAERPGQPCYPIEADGRHVAQLERQTRVRLDGGVPPHRAVRQ